jgi:hypothetical protein
MNTWFLMCSEAADAPRNMALDEALLENMPRLQNPVLRFYSWTDPAASFGYFQKFREVEKLTHLRPLVRRPTGGGIVPHDADWTYSLTFPTNHEWYGLKAVGSYRGVHEWLRAAFANLGSTLKWLRAVSSQGPASVSLAMSNMICCGKDARSPAPLSVAPGWACSSRDPSSHLQSDGLGMNGNLRCVSLVPGQVCSGPLCNRTRNSRKRFRLS